MCHKCFEQCWVGNTNLYFGVLSSYDVSSIMTSLLCHYWYITISAGIYPRSTKDHKHSEKTSKNICKFLKFNRSTEPKKRFNPPTHPKNETKQRLSALLRWFPFFRLEFPFFGAVSGPLKRHQNISTGKPPTSDLQKSANLRLKPKRNLHLDWMNRIISGGEEILAFWTFLQKNVAVASWYMRSTMIFFVGQVEGEHQFPGFPRFFSRT